MMMIERVFLFSGVSAAAFGVMVHSVVFFLGLSEIVSHDLPEEHMT